MHRPSARLAPCDAAIGCASSLLQRGAAACGSRLLRAWLAAAAQCATTERATHQRAATVCANGCGGMAYAAPNVMLARLSSRGSLSVAPCMGRDILRRGLTVSGVMEMKSAVFLQVVGDLRTGAEAAEWFTAAAWTLAVMVPLPQVGTSRLPVRLAPAVVSWLMELVFARLAEEHIFVPVGRASRERRLQDAPPKISGFGGGGGPVFLRKEKQPMVKVRSSMCPAFGGLARMPPASGAHA